MKSIEPLFTVEIIENAVKFLSTESFSNESALCKLMNHYGSDKGDISPWGKGHRYAPFYDSLFSPVNLKVKNIFELGIRTTNEKFRCHMTTNGKEGASLLAWHDYFINALIYGADLDKNCLFQSERIQTYYCDQQNPSSIRQMLVQIDSSIQFDIVIEDGMHTFESSLCFLLNIIHRVISGGLFVIEDISDESLSKYELILSTLKMSIPLAYSKLVHIPDVFGNNNCDNNLLIVLR